MTSAGINKKDLMRERFESLLKKRGTKENSAVLTREKLLTLIAEAPHSSLKRTPYEDMFGCAPRVGLSTTPIPREVFDAVEDKQQFENASTALNACSELEDDAVNCQRSIFE
ncbi:hypothetical protein NPIL_487281 [Nephila pilipes]|uniref:Uncharacterized protein n=1 Tax=Nephila pilipes TaxID=299642 RepID=A0A8X6MTH5_NEPPI|nr:hypothetical protein NPIL_487281 [Nephila pilipes]